LYTLFLSFNVIDDNTLQAHFLLVKVLLVCLLSRQMSRHPISLRVDRLLLVGRQALEDLHLLVQILLAHRRILVEVVQAFTQTGYV